MELLLLGLVGVIMAPTLYVAGLHDVPNSIAIPVRTRALTPRIAVRVAAAFNALGVLLALPMGLYLYSWFEFPSMEPVLALSVVIASLTAILAWNVFTYFRGMPTSITHGLLAALLGGTLAAVTVGDVRTEDILSLPWMTPLLTLLVSPLVAFGLAYVLVFAAVRIARGEDPHDVNRVARGCSPCPWESPLWAQVFSKASDSRSSYWSHSARQVSLTPRGGWARPMWCSLC